MAEIKAMYPETMTSREQYLMLKNPNSIKMADAKGKQLSIDAYVIFEDVNLADGELMKVVSIRSGADVYVTNSKSFIREFETMLAAFGDDLPKINVTSAKSSKGRAYLTCSVVL